MADSTPPVCLAAFAASAISGANPMRTGVQSFLYDIRTSILPIVFIFNPELLLVGVTSYWHVLLIFVVSLIALLCFASLTQGWLLTRVSIVERILLAVVVVALFRPDFLMNQVYPQYAKLGLADSAALAVAPVPNDRAIRLHVTRETEYGDRYKLFVIPSRKGAKDGVTPLGKRVAATLSAEADGRLAVTDLGVRGAAEKAGVTFGDYVTDIDVEQRGRPAKEWI